MSALDFVGPSSPGAWDDAVLSLPAATPFHSWAFLASYAAVAGLRFEPLLVRRGGRVVGGVPQLVTRRGPFRWVNHGLPFCFAGPALPTELLTNAMHLLRRRYRPRTVRARLEVRGVVPPDLGSAGWLTRSGETMVIRVGGRDEHSLLGRTSRTFRQQLRHAERAGVVVAPATDTELDVVLPDLVGARFRAQALPSPYPAALVAAVRQAFAGVGLVQANAARLDGATVGAQLSLVHGGRAYGWLIGAADGQRGVGVQAALLWASVRTAREAGLDTVDLGGVPTPGIRHFKLSAGAEAEEYAVLEYDLRGTPAPARATVGGRVTQRLA